MEAQVQTGSVKLAQRSEVRIVAPTHYRRAFVPEPEMQSVKELLAELASTSKVRPCHLTGGSWNWQQIQPSSKKEHCQLVGWLKLPKEEAKKLLAVSGQRGIFVYPQQRNGEHSKIWWVKKLPAEEDDVYLKRVLALATERSQNLVFRKGLGTDLGFPRTEADPTEARPKFIQITNVPSDWQAEELRDLLVQQRRTNVEIHGFRGKKRKQAFWNAKAQPPPETAGQAAWCYECADEFCVTINENLSRPSRVHFGPAPEGSGLTQRKTPLSKSPHNGSEADLRDAILRNPRKEESRARPNLMRKWTLRRTTSNSQLKTQPLKPIRGLIRPSWGEAILAGWQEIDQQGNGDCGWRALADNWAWRKERLLENKSVFSNPTGSEQPASGIFVLTQGSTLLVFRGPMCLKRHGTLSLRQGEPLLTSLRLKLWGLEAYLDKAVRSGHWICARLLQATADRLWKIAEANAVDRRFVIAPAFSLPWPRVNSKSPPLVILLRSNHYTSLRTPHEGTVPWTWLRETNLPGPEDLPGGADHQD